MTTNDMRKIDLAWLRREGVLRTGYSGSLSWSRGAHRIAEIGYEIQREGLRLTYRLTPHGGTPIQVDEVVSFARTGQHLGGTRLWFVCPSCRRRARTLFGGRYFRCRGCHDLRYASQYEAPYDRAIERANRIREKLGDKVHSAFECDELPDKPPRMRWRTYRRLEAEYRDLQARWKAGVIARFGLRVLDMR